MLTFTYFEIITAFHLKWSHCSVIRRKLLPPLAYNSFIFCTLHARSYSLRDHVYIRILFRRYQHFFFFYTFASLTHTHIQPRTAAHRHIRQNFTISNVILYFCLFLFFCFHFISFIRLCL